MTGSQGTPSAVITREDYAYSMDTWKRYAVTATLLGVGLGALADFLGAWALSGPFFWQSLFQCLLVVHAILLLPKWYLVNRNGVYRFSGRPIRPMQHNERFNRLCKTTEVILARRDEWNGHPVAWLLDNGSRRHVLCFRNEADREAALEFLSRWAG